MSSQLSQFMDQTNPLAELEHKRRLSALGPGGLARERAGFEVRDVHATHYSRICPIATPEGPNIGLVGHLASYARINDFGFIEAPYCRVIHDIENEPAITVGQTIRQDIEWLDQKTKKTTIIAKAGQVIDEKLAKTLHDKLGGNVTIPVVPTITNEIIYLDAASEEKFITVAFTAPVDKSGHFINERMEGRRYGEPAVVDASEVDFIGVAANQIVSIGTSLIPFLEHDDGIRALMGTNMQRQAVPLVMAQSPIVGTGMEARAAKDSGHAIVAPEDGVITYADSLKIELTGKSGQIHTFKLNKYLRSNASTCINQKLIVFPGKQSRK